MAQNLLSCTMKTSPATTYFWRHSGVSNSILASFSLAIQSMRDLVQTPNDNDIISGSSNTDNIYFLTGFTTTINNSFSAKATANGMGITVDGSNNVIQGADSTQKFYVYTGETSTVSNSFASPNTVPTGITFDGSNLISGDDTANKFYRHQGVSSTITTSMAAPATRPSGNTWDYDLSNLISTDGTLGKYYVHSGFSTSITNSFAKPDANNLSGVCYPRQAPSGSNAVYPAAIATFPRVTKNTILSQGLWNQWVYEVSALQDDLQNIRLNFSSLVSYFYASRNTMAALRQFSALFHSALLSVTASQHHTRLHASSHWNTVDDIALASKGRVAGMVSSTMSKKVVGAVQSCTKNRAKYSTYAGLGTNPKTVTIGFSAKEMRIIDVTATAGTFWAFFWRRGVSLVLAEGSTAHCSTAIKCIWPNATNQIRISGIANRSGKTYKYIAL